MRSPGLDENIPVDKPKEKKNECSGKKSKKTKAMPSTSYTDGLPAPEKSQTGSLNIVRVIPCLLVRILVLSLLNLLLLYFTLLPLPVILVLVPVKTYQQPQNTLMLTLSLAGPTKIQKMVRSQIWR